MRTKAVPVKVKADATDGLEDGQFDALVSVFGNVDSYGDVVMPGAFADTLAEWKASGNPIPVLWSHQIGDPDSHIGYVVDAVETEKGLQVRAQLDLDEPKAAKVYKLLKGRRVTQFSFSYDVIEGAYVEQNVDGETKSHYELRKIKLYEVGPTLIGANQDTELIDVKSGAEHIARGLKAGRVLSAANEAAIDSAVAAISDGVDGLQGVLLQVRGTDDEKATSGQQEASAEPEGAASVEPARPTPLARKSELATFELAYAGL